MLAYRGFKLQCLVTLMVPLVPVITASQAKFEVTEHVHTASLFLENLRTKTVVPSTPRTKMEVFGSYIYMYCLAQLSL